ncbi:sporulation protein YjcZ [Cohnella thailandensis]|uniref:Sporulation protein YjcZ n=1 Tax=Cohnella thailandensis TaxID=557557 RepID=A0A841SWH7_9BACL|nr:sporulation protein YjcZ [Cohnella thailandensis]
MAVIDVSGYPVAGTGTGPCYGGGGVWAAATIALVLFVLLVIILRAGY